VLEPTPILTTDASAYVLVQVLQGRSATAA